MRRDVMKIAKDRGVKWIRLAFVDIFGIEKNITVPVSELERAMNGRVTFDGGSIDGFIREEELDMLLRPDAATFAILPWTLDSGAPEARMLCDIAMPDGTPFEGCPRSTLKRVLDDAEDVLHDVKTALEVEFYLFERDADGTPTTRTIDAGSYFDYSPSDRGDDAPMHLDIVWARIDRLHRRVHRLQPDAAALVEELLERRLVLRLQPDRDHVAVLQNGGGLVGADDLIL